MGQARGTPQPKGDGAPIATKFLGPLYVHPHRVTKFCVVIKLGEREVLKALPGLSAPWGDVSGQKIIALMLTRDLFAVDNVS